MAANVSKTARASVNAGAGQTKLVAKAWIFQHKPGKMQTKPYLTMYTQEAADQFMSTHGDEFYMIKWDDKKGKK